FPIVQRFTTQEAPNGTNTPITEIVVNALITSLEDGAQIPVGQATTLGGVAWDGGYGIAEVQLSVDGGDTWVPARLGEDLGRFSWRPFSYDLTPPAAGAVTVMARARNNAGATQVDKAIFNPPGYHHNVVQQLDLVAA